MSLVHRYSYRLKHYLLPFSLSCMKHHQLVQLLKILLTILLGLLLITLLNGLLFSSVLLLQEPDVEPDFDFDTRPFYRAIETKKRFDDSGNYLIIPNFVHYATNLTHHAELLALSLHADVDQLHVLLQHARVWDGPISLSLYIRGVRGSDDIDYAAMWLRCHRKAFKMLHVHLVISAQAYKSK